MTVSSILAMLLVPLLQAQVSPVQAPSPQNPPATAQPRWEPPDPTNLKVFPKTITKPELVSAMRFFTRALGVRCEFCHVGEGNDLTKFDFASDDRRQKRNARVMIQMTGDLNAKLADIPEPRPAGTPAVTCFTCHRGEKKPVTLPPPPGAPGV